MNRLPKRGQRRHLLELLLQLLELAWVGQLVLQQQRAHVLYGVARAPARRTSRQSQAFPLQLLLWGDAHGAACWLGKEDRGSAISGHAGGGNSCMHACGRKATMQARLTPWISSRVR